MERKTAVIIGAGPAGLTAAYELLENSDVKPIVFEMSGDIGGISKTLNYKGNRIDIGGHRFFSKSDRVMSWWMNVMPLQGGGDEGEDEKEITYRRSRRSVVLDRSGPDPETSDLVMLIRNRLSRILFFRKFFDYPISLNWKTVSYLGPVRVARIGFSYMKARAFPIRKEKSLEDFFINRFGRELYETFFKDYTEKVWGVSCRKIGPEWGAQRIKGLSVTKALVHAARSLLVKDVSIGQKKTETSLIEQFMYPKYGPGQLWEEVARRVEEKGGEIHLNHRAVALAPGKDGIDSVVVADLSSGGERAVSADYFFSTMPIKELIAALGGEVPVNVKEVAEGLMYRDFMTVGLLLRKMSVKEGSGKNGPLNLIPDNWVYIQEPDVRIGRLQVFNNWSPYMVREPDTVWLGLEYFCNEDDDLYTMPEAEAVEFAVEELERIGIIDRVDLLDSTVIRMAKTYPAYFGTYGRFSEIRSFTDTLENLFLIGRNGQHRYNNSDHSMLTAMAAVENIVDKTKGKDNVWSVNVEQDYHEEKRS